ncbi:RNase A-like domain-containing protein [Streptomyces sp. NPDC049040]|uniref:RNase A-like domain-containing protein n=1 Tax=Streptomyces sp. NPDC049040 TaxID=3365593 RepID=UPI003712BACF
MGAPDDMGDGRPTDKQRSDEIKGLATPPPNASGGFDVKPSNLYHASYQVRDEQFTFDKAARTLMDALSGHEQLAGKGTGPGKLAAAYLATARLFFDVWGAAVVSIGGASVGFTATANNYAAADWYTNRKQYGPPPHQEPPWVMRVPTYYGEVPDLTWRGTDADSDHAIVRALGHIPDFVADHTQGLLDQVLRLGRMYEITPGADKDELRTIAAAWGTISGAGSTSADSLDDIVGTITNQRNGAWQKAMWTFCQTIWGTSAWGGPQGAKGGYPGQDFGTRPALGAARRPIVAVLGDTATAVQSALLDLVDAADKVTAVSEPAAEHAAKEMAKDMAKNAVHNPFRALADLTPFGAVDLTAQMVMSFRSHMDYAGINAAVDAYNETCTGLAATLGDLGEVLQEAKESAPTFNAEEARAEAFGGRSLNDFKDKHLWTLQTDSADVHKYPVDLVNQEGLRGAHPIDRHVDKTDAQLVQRMRDQKPDAASTYRDLDSAQAYTQQCLDIRAGDIQDWINGGAVPKSRAFPVDFGSTGPVTGRSVTEAAYNASPRNPAVTESHGVTVVLKYAQGLTPPFVVLTSYPS